MHEKAKIKQQLASHLRGGHAFMAIDELLKEIGFDQIGERPNNLPYSFYELFYHVWFAQKDISDFCSAEDYNAHNWPKDYWSADRAPSTSEAWEELKTRYFDDRQQFIDLLLKPETELLAPVRQNTDHTFLSEALLVIEHTAYHTGQLLIVLRNLGLYK